MSSLAGLAGRGAWLIPLLWQHCHDGGAKSTHPGRVGELSIWGVAATAAAVGAKENLPAELFPNYVHAHTDTHTHSSVLAHFPK